MPKKLVVGGATALTVIAVSVAAYAAGGPMMMGAAHTIAQPSFQGYYDGHKDTYLSTDISSKTEAKAMHINYSASIGKVKGLPEIYLVQGTAAAVKGAKIPILAWNHSLCTPSSSLARSPSWRGARSFCSISFWSFAFLTWDRGRNLPTYSIAPRLTGATPTREPDPQRTS